jgi:hypothetical protein
MESEIFRKEYLGGSLVGNKPHLLNKFNYVPEDARKSGVKGAIPRQITGHPLCEHGQPLPQRCGATRSHGACRDPYPQ